MRTASLRQAVAKVPIHLPRAALVILGVLVITWGCIAGTFYVALPGLHEYKWKSVPKWLGRLWYILIGMAAIYMGMRR